MKLPYLNSGSTVPQPVWEWAKRIVDLLNQGDKLPQFTDDAAAAAASLPLHAEYFDDTGIRRRRVA